MGVKWRHAQSTHSEIHHDIYIYINSDLTRTQADSVSWDATPRTDQLINPHLSSWLQPHHAKRQRLDPHALSFIKMPNSSWRARLPSALAALQSSVVLHDAAPSLGEVNITHMAIVTQNRIVSLPPQPSSSSSMYCVASHSHQILDHAGVRCGGPICGFQSAVNARQRSVRSANAWLG